MATLLICPHCNAKMSMRAESASPRSQVQCPGCSTCFRIEESLTDLEVVESARRSPAGSSRGSAWHRDEEEEEDRAPRKAKRRTEEDELVERIGRQIRKAPTRNLWLILGLSIGGGAIALAGLIVVVVLLFQSEPTPGQQTANNNPLPAEQIKPNAPVQPLANDQAQAANPPNPNGSLSKEVLDKVKQATVMVRVVLRDGRGSGTGFFEAGSGLVMTNAHVVGMLERGLPPRQVEIVLNSGQGPQNERVLAATVVTVDRGSDLAVLRPILPDPGITLPHGLTVSSAMNLQETQEVYIFGFPFGEQLGKNITVSKTSVSSLRNGPDGRLQQIQVNGGMHPGNSGGPVVDARGNVIGVAVAGIRGTQINFAIPGDSVNAVLRNRAGF